MTRYFCGILLAASLAGTLHAQGSKYTPVQGGTRDPEAIKKLAAMLGNGGQPQIDPKMKELLEKWLKDTENDPEARQKMIDFARKQKEENPDQFQQDFKKNNPNISEDDLKKLMQGLGKPGDPPPELPKPGPGPMPPIPPKPMPNPNDPPMPVQIDPNTGFPQQQPPKPFPPKPLNPNQPKNAEQVEGAVQMWEQTVGPIDSTPAVKDAIIDLFGNGAGGAGEKPFWMNGPDGQNGSSSSNSGFWKFMNGSSSGSSGSSWNTPSWLKNFSAGSPSTPSAPKTSGMSGPSMPGMGGIGSIGIGGLGGAGTVLLFLVVAVVVGFLIWKFLPMIREARNRRLQPLPGQGPWPVDPRTIRDREALVIAFEYLSVLVCGNGAVVWNHETIAEALREALPDREHLAGPLARLYAVARYTPLREEIPESAYAEARRCLCALAGVSEG